MGRGHLETMDSRTISILILLPHDLQALQSKTNKVSDAQVGFKWDLRLRSRAQAAKGKRMQGLGLETCRPPISNDFQPFPMIFQWFSMAFIEILRAEKPRAPRLDTCRPFS